MKAKREREIQERTIERWTQNAELLQRPMAIEGTLFDWIAVHGYLQLALRHPETTGPSRRQVEGVIRMIEEICEEEGLLDQETLEYMRQDQAEAEVEGRTRQQLFQLVQSQTRCRGCGCTEERACAGGCSWIQIGPEPGWGLCSGCFE